MRTKPNFLFSLFTLVLFLTNPLVVFAHHSTAAYDSENPVELAGTVVEWKFTNPHCIIIMSVADASGTVTRWSVEGGNTAGIFRNGWTPETLKPGDEIIVTARPLRSGAPAGNFSNPRWKDGTPIAPKATKAPKAQSQN
jgi:hypothetical protein